MGDSILKLDCEVTFDNESGLEIHLRHGGSLSHGVAEHLERAGDEILLALGQLAGTARQPQEKVRTKIEIEEA